MTIQPYSLRAITGQSVTISAFLIQDDLKRNVTVQGPYNDFGSWNPPRLENIFRILLKLSDIPENPTSQQFLTMTFKDFKNLTITNELMSQNTDLQQ